MHICVKYTFTHIKRKCWSSEIAYVGNIRSFPDLNLSAQNIFTGSNLTLKSNEGNFFLHSDIIIKHNLQLFVNNVK